MKISTKKNDADIKKDVWSELEYEPSVNPADINVWEDGMVTLTGYASSYIEKVNAVRAAKRVSGVAAITDEIKVRLPPSQRFTDGELAAAAEKQIKCSALIPSGQVELTVYEGWIKLEGEVEWWYHKGAAENVVNHLAGVKGVTNLIRVIPKLPRTGLATAVNSAIERNGLLDASKIHVEVSGSEVILRGEVRNHVEWEEAERTAWAAPGVSSVDNQLEVAWWEYVK